MPRRASWRTSSQRRSRPSAGTSGNNNNNQSQYALQLNQYKSLRGGASNALGSSGIIDDIYERNTSSSRPRGLAGSSNSRGRGEDNNHSKGVESFDDDDDLGLDDDLDNILSGIENDTGASSDNAKGSNRRLVIEPLTSDASIPLTVAADEENSAHQIAIERDLLGSDDTLTNTFRTRVFQPVNFGGDDVGTRDNTSDPTFASHNGDVDDTLENDSDTLLSEGEATRQHKMMLQTGEAPVFSSEGFRVGDARGSEPMSITGPSLQNTTNTKSSASIVNSILDEVEKDIRGESEAQHNVDFSTAKTPPRGEITKPIHNPLNSAPSSGQSMLHPDSEDARDKIHDLPFHKTSARNQQMPPQNILGEVHRHHNQEDDSMSTVTDITESPFIYTYKTARDDDSVSQITSSVAASTMGSSYLQNVHTTTSECLLRNRIGGSNGLSWMGGAAPGNRMNRRKGGAVVQGAFGRDRTGGYNNMRGISSGSGASGYTGYSNTHINSKCDISSKDSSNESGGDGSREGVSSLDEIAYALNAECKSGRQRARRTGGVNYTGSNDDLSTIISEQAGTRNRQISTLEYDAKSNISGLGMGGVSCGGQSIAGTNTLSGTSRTSSSLGSRGLIQGLLMLAWKAQHHAERFFFPTSPKVTQRKKYDRSDSLDDLLLEEGANTLPHRKRNSRADEEDDESVDYFSRAMSTNSQGSCSRGQQRASAIRIASAIFIMTCIMTMFSGSSGRKKKRLNGAGSGIQLPTFQVEFAAPGSVGFDDRVIRRNRHEKRPGHEDEHDQHNNQDHDQLDNFDVINADDGRHQESLEVAKRDSARPIDRFRHIVKDLPLPSVFDNLSNVDDGSFQKGIDVPFYWHVPRSGGGTVNDVLGR